MAIRTATPEDHVQIIEVVRAAFSIDGRDGSAEVDIVRATWHLDAVADHLEIVAVVNGRIVGHVLGGLGDLEGRAAVGIAPLAVLPAFQGERFGTALMEELLRRAEAAGQPLVVLLGSPAYYGRFGFEPGGSSGVVYQPVGASNPHFQIRRLRGYDDSFQGAFRYCWEHAQALQ